MDQALETYRVLVKICDKARALSEANNKYISEFGLPLIGTTKDKKYSTVLADYFDKLHDQIMENFYVELIASFESKMIDRVTRASGEMKSVLKDRYDSKSPFASYEDRFVKNKDDIGSLNKVVDLLDGKLSKEKHEALKKVVQFRDKLAHGKRFNEDVVLNSLDDTYTLLKSILDELDGSAD